MLYTLSITSFLALYKWKFWNTQPHLVVKRAYSLDHVVEWSTHFIENGACRANKTKQDRSWWKQSRCDLQDHWEANRTNTVAWYNATIQLDLSKVSESPPALMKPSFEIHCMLYCVALKINVLRPEVPKQQNPKLAVLALAFKKSFWALKHQRSE